MIKVFSLDYKLAIPLVYAMTGPASRLVDQLLYAFDWGTGENEWRSEKELDTLIKVLDEAKKYDS